MIHRGITLPFQSFPFLVGPRSGDCGYVVSEIMFQKWLYHSNVKVKEFL